MLVKKGVNNERQNPEQNEFFRLRGTHMICLTSTRNRSGRSSHVFINYVGRKSSYALI